MRNLPSTVGVVNRTGLPKPEKATVKHTLPSIKGICQDTRLSRRARETFFALFSFTGKDNSHCFPSILGLAQRMGMGWKTIRAGINELVEFGYVQTTSKYGKDHYHLLPTVTLEIEVDQIGWNSPDESAPAQKMLKEKQAQGDGLANRGGEKGLRFTKPLTDEPAQGFKSCAPVPNDNLNRSNDQRIGSNVRERVRTEAEVHQEKDNVPSENRLFNHFSSLSERQKPILLDQVKKSAFKLRESSKHDGKWDSESERKRFVTLRDFHKQAEAELFGVPVTDWR